MRRDHGEAFSFFRGDLEECLALVETQGTVVDEGDGGRGLDDGGDVVGEFELGDALVELEFDTLGECAGFWIGGAIDGPLGVTADAESGLGGWWLGGGEVHHA